MGASSSSAIIKPLKVSESNPDDLKGTFLQAGYYFDNKLYMCNSKLKLYFLCIRMCLEYVEYSFTQYVIVVDFFTDQIRYFIIG
jgi:hypothetical protein